MSHEGVVLFTYHGRRSTLGGKGGTEGFLGECMRAIGCLLRCMVRLPVNDGGRVHFPGDTVR